MKVLMLGWELPPHNSGGLGVACLQLCKALNETGAVIEFIVPFSDSVRPNYDFMKVTAAYSEDAWKNKKLNSYESFGYFATSTQIAGGSGDNDQQAAYEKAVVEISSGLEFDIIHAHDWLTFRAALRTKEASGKPLIVHIHSIERDRAGGQYGNPLVREIEATAMLIADKVITVSRRTAQMIEREYAVPANKIEVIHNSLEQIDIPDLDGENSYSYLTALKSSGWRVIVNVGRLTIQKGLPHLLQAMTEVVKLQPKTLLLLVGNGEQRDELVEVAAELGIADKVLFAGFQRGKAWRDAYQIADLFVMPSVSEPFGLTPLEAVGYGTPALISKQSGVSEVLKNCLKVDFWDSAEMANQIHAVVAYDVLGSSLQANAALEYQRLSWNGAADKMMDVYLAHRQKAAL